MLGGFYNVLDNGVEDADLTDTKQKAFHSSQFLEIRMFNAGNGEIVLLTMPDRRSVWIVDAGSGAKINAPASAIVDFLGSQLVLRGVVLSHPHQDHGRAIAKVLKTAPLVQQVTFYRSDDPRFWPATGWLSNLRTEVSAQGVEEIVVTKGEPQRSVDFGAGVVADMFTGDHRKKGLTSIFLIVRFGAARLLFTGDVADCKYEQELLDQFGSADFEADVLKLTHHGNSNGTSRKLLCAVKPGIAIASTARDSGHRLEGDVIDRLQAGASAPEIYETHVHGDIVLRTDGTRNGNGVLYHVERMAPGRFENALRATTGTVKNAERERTGAGKHKTCKEDC